MALSETSTLPKPKKTVTRFAPDARIRERNPNTLTWLFFSFKGRISRTRFVFGLIVISLAFGGVYFALGQMDSRPWVNVTPAYPQQNGVQNRVADFVSEDLPKGLSIDPTGRISGRVEGDFAYTDTVLKANVKQIAANGQVLATTPVTIQAGFFPVPLTLCFSIAFAFNWWTIWALSSKRWHDRNKSAAWNLVWLVPVIGAIWAVFDLFIRRGSKGSNNYGAPPALPRLG